MIHQAIKLGVHRYNIIKQKQYVHDLAWVSPESPSEFYEEVAQMPMFPTLTTLASQYQPALVVSLGFSGISIQRRWPGPGLPMVLQTSSESGKLLLHIATLWGIPEGQWWRKCLPVGRILNNEPGCSLACKEKCPDLWWYNSLWVLMNGLAGWLGTLKKYDWKIDDKKNCERDMWVFL